MADGRHCTTGGRGARPIAGVHSDGGSSAVFAKRLGTGLLIAPYYAVSLKKYSSRMPLGFYRVGVTLDVL